MSSDLYFLSRWPGQLWEDAMAALEEDVQSEQPLDDAELET